MIRVGVAPDGVIISRLAPLASAGSTPSADILPLAGPGLITPTNSAYGDRPGPEAAPPCTWMAPELVCTAGTIQTAYPFASELVWGSPDAVIENGNRFGPLLLTITVPLRDPPWGGRSAASYFLCPPRAGAGPGA